MDSYNSERFLKRVREITDKSSQDIDEIFYHSYELVFIYTETSDERIRILIAEGITQEQFLEELINFCNGKPTTKIYIKHSIPDDDPLFMSRIRDYIYMHVKKKENAETIDIGRKLADCDFRILKYLVQDIIYFIFNDPKKVYKYLGLRSKVFEIFSYSADPPNKKISKINDSALNFSTLIDPTINNYVQLDFTMYYESGRKLLLFSLYILPEITCGILDHEFFNTFILLRDASKYDPLESSICYGYILSKIPIYFPPEIFDDEKKKEIKSENPVNMKITYSFKNDRKNWRPVLIPVYEEVKEPESLTKVLHFLWYFFSDFNKFSESFDEQVIIEDDFRKKLLATGNMDNVELYSFLTHLKFK